jgi:hypothetical protein
MADENKKPETMLEALEDAGARIDKTIVNSFNEVRTKTPEMSIGAQVRMFHFAFIRSLREAPVTAVFPPTLGIIAKCLLPHLTDDEKEALRNDKLSGLL